MKNLSLNLIYIDYKVIFRSNALLSGPNFWSNALGLLGGGGGGGGNAWN